MIIKWVLAFILLIHGLIHILGGFSELRIADFNNLTGKLLFHIPPWLRTLLGAAWILTTVLFFAAAVALVGGEPWLLPLTLSTVILSQILIIIWWHDAKYGTIMNLLILLGLFFIR